MAVERITASGTKTVFRWQWRWLLFAFVAPFVLGVVAFATLKPIQVLPRVRPGPPFVLADQAGQRVTNEDLRGQIVLYTFGYTGCGAACEPLDEVMKAAQANASSLTSQGLPLTLVTMLFDPERDTSRALQTYSQTLGVDSSRWRLLTGDPARLKQVIGGGFEVYYSAKPDGSFEFEPAAVLVDEYGIIRAEYRGQAQTLDAQTVLRHITVLEDEIRNGRGASRAAYEAAHFFLCYAHY